MESSALNEIKEKVLQLNDSEQFQLMEMMIHHLSHNHQRKTADQSFPAPALNDEPFVGMWVDHEDLQNSSEWVRSQRNQEWGK